MSARTFAVLQSRFHSRGATDSIRGYDVVSRHRSEQAAAKIVRRHRNEHDCSCGGYRLVEIVDGDIVEVISVSKFGPADCSDRYSAGYGVGS